VEALFGSIDVGVALGLVRIWWSRRTCECAYVLVVAGGIAISKDYLGSSSLWTFWGIADADHYHGPKRHSPFSGHGQLYN